MATTTGMTGILTPAQEQQLAVWLDEILKLKGVWGIVEEYFFKVLITLLNKELLDKIQADLKVKLSALITLAMNGDVQGAEQMASDLLVSVVKIPGVDSTTEGLLFMSAIQIIVAAILNKVQTVTGKQVTLKVVK